MTPIFMGEGGSVLDFYTEEEKLLSMETGYTLSESELAERMEESMEEYLASEKHLSFVRARIEAVLEQYPEYSFDSDYMDPIANTYEEVREKFEKLREDNIGIESSIIAKPEYKDLQQKAINVHLSRLLSFMYAYVKAIEELNNRTKELNLILYTLPQRLNDEYGNTTDPFRLFFEGIGKGFGFIGVGIGNIFSGLMTGLGFSLDKDLLIKIGIGILIVVVVIIIGLIGFNYVKTYISQKAIKRASK